jgi:hypothetical protein
MSNIFNKNLPIIDFYNFLKIYCNFENNFYIFDSNIYKKYVYEENFLQNFINNLKTLYKKKNLFYLNRDLNFNNFSTILRHICKSNNIDYHKKIQYYKNSYNIIYYINNKSI